MHAIGNWNSVIMLADHEGDKTWPTHICWSVRLAKSPFVNTDVTTLISISKLLEFSTICTWKLLPCLSLLESDLNSNEELKNISSVVHILWTEACESTQMPSLLLNICKQIAITGAEGFCIWPNAVFLNHRHGIILMCWNSTRCAGHCVARKKPAPVIFSSQMMMPSKFGAFSTFCQRTCTHWSSLQRR